MAISPKLKQARAEIEAILQKYDLGATFYLYTNTGIEEKRDGTFHATGICEYSMNLDTSYSCLKASSEGIRFRSLKDEYSGDTIKQAADQAASINMLESIAAIQSEHALRMLELHKILKKRMGGSSEDYGHRPHKR